MSGSRIRLVNVAFWPLFRIDASRIRRAGDFRPAISARPETCAELEARDLCRRVDSFSSRTDPIGLECDGAVILGWS